MRYFFDLREGDKVVLDDEGIDFSSAELAQEEAVLSLGNLARDFVITNGTKEAAHTMAIHVRDENGPVIKAYFAFEVGRADH